LSLLMSMPAFLAVMRAVTMTVALTLRKRIMNSWSRPTGALLVRAWNHRLNTEPMAKRIARTMTPTMM
jgi:hypothetical protein